MISKSHQKQMASSAELSTASSICFPPLESIEYTGARRARTHRLKEKHVSILTLVHLRRFSNEAYG